MARKLTLDPDSLSIESFESGSAAQVEGTVEAHGGKAFCAISAGIRYSCPPSWDCREAVLPGDI